MNTSRALIGALFICMGAGVVGVRYYRTHRHEPGPVAVAPQKSLLTKEQLAKLLEDSGSFYQFPAEIDLPINPGQKVHVKLNYAFDPKLEKTVEGLFQSYKPDYGAFVAIDATTGRVLAISSYAREKEMKENLAFRATFPSASVFKVVTAAAAIENENYSPETVISFNGRNHTLYKSNILKTSTTRWTRYITLKEAFAKSINTVFGKIGAYAVGPTKLRDYAGRFGFNRKIAADVPLQEGKAAITEDPWELAEAASGYTRENTMSPLQGALIGAAIVNDGVMMEPYVIQSVTAPDGTALYSAEAKLARATVDPKTASEIRALMKETVTHGTSRRSFRGFFRGELSLLDVGGKTGSLTGKDPPGKYDWFVGFAEKGTQKIAFGVLTINEDQWRVKSSYLARRAIESLFKRTKGESVAER